MTTSTITAVPASLGGEAAFPKGLPLMRPTLPDLPRLERRLGAVLRSGMLTNGPAVRELEERVADRLGVHDVVAVASCTSGLALTLQALGAQGPVVMPSFTFSASAHAVVWAKGRPVFADIRPDTLCLDPQAARGLFDGAVAMTATHLYGTPCATEALAQAAAEAGVPVVYDAAHALGSRRRDVPVGRFGVAEVFSLSPTKVVVAGEGGLVATNDAGLADTLRTARNYGNPGDYDCLFPGLNARMSELHAVVALHSLEFLDEHVRRRNELADIFWNAVAGLPGLRRPVVEEGDVSTYKDLTVIVDQHGYGLDAAELAGALAHEGVESRHYYRPSIHEQLAYRDLEPRSLPVTEAMATSVVSLPLLSHMSDGQMNRVAGAVARIHQHAARIRALGPERTGQP